MGIPGTLFIYSLAFPLSSTGDIWNRPCDALLGVFQLDNHSPHFTKHDADGWTNSEKQAQSTQYLIGCHSRSSVPDFWHLSYISGNNPPGCRWPLDVPLPLNLNRGVCPPYLRIYDQRGKEYLQAELLSEPLQIKFRIQTLSPWRVPLAPLFQMLCLWRVEVCLHTLSQHFLSFIKKSCTPKALNVDFFFSLTLCFFINSKTLRVFRVAMMFNIL